MGWDAYMAKGSWEEYCANSSYEGFVYARDLLDDPTIKVAIDDAMKELLSFPDVTNCCLLGAELCGGRWQFEQIVGELAWARENKDGQLYWPHHKVQQVYNRIQHNIERDRARFSYSECNSSDYEQIRLFLKVCEENDLGILFTW